MRMFICTARSEAQDGDCALIPSGAKSKQLGSSPMKETQRKQCWLGCILLSLILLPRLSFGDAVSVHWMGPEGQGGNGKWSIASNWSTGVVPNNGIGTQYDVSITGDSLVLEDMLTEVEDFAMDNGPALLDVAPGAMLTARSLKILDSATLLVETGSGVYVLDDSFFGSHSTVEVRGILNVEGNLLVAPGATVIGSENIHVSVPEPSLVFTVTLCVVGLGCALGRRSLSGS